MNGGRQIAVRGKVQRGRAQNRQSAGREAEIGEICVKNAAQAPDDGSPGMRAQ